MISEQLKKDVEEFLQNEDEKELKQWVKHTMFLLGYHFDNMSTSDRKVIHNFIKTCINEHNWYIRKK